MGKKVGKVRERAEERKANKRITWLKSKYSCFYTGTTNTQAAGLVHMQGIPSLTQPFLC